jgi:hypothetical protein
VGAIYIPFRFEPIVLGTAVLKAAMLGPVVSGFGNHPMAFKPQHAALRLSMAAASADIHCR